MVGKCHAVIDFHRADGRANIFNRPVVQAFGTEAAQHVEREVLGPHAGLQAAIELHPHRFGHAQPDLAGRHDCSHISTLNAGAKGIERAVGGGMGVGANDEVATGQMAALGQHLVANAVTNVVEHAAVLVGEAPHGAVCLRGLQIGRGRVVVKYPGGLAGKRQTWRAHLVNHAYGIGRSGVMHHGEVDVCDDDITSLDVVQTGVPGQDFFCNRCIHVGLHDLLCLDTGFAHQYTPFVALLTHEVNGFIRR